jgi:CelD/BcsL family acetyltransferase involved in cellulose biosynthesis
MKVEVIRSVEGLASLRSEWQRLHSEEGTLPFTSWEWNVAWWEHLARRRLSMTDRLYVHTFRGPKGDLVAVAPLMLTSLPSVGPRFRCLQFFGADKNLTEIRCILCRGGLEGVVYGLLLDRLFARRFEWDCFMADGFREAGPVPLRLARCDGVTFVESRPDLVLPLPKTWDEFRSTRSRNIKESLRKCANSLKRDGLAPVHEVATKGRALTTAVDTLFRLHGARASLKDTIAHKNVFDTRASRAFVRDVCDRLSAVDGVRAFSMKIGDRTVATRLGFSIGRSLYLYYSGYDPAFGKYSVMTSVVAEAIKYAIANGYERVNLSTGLDVSKSRWSPETVAYGSAVVPSDTPLAKLVTRGYFSLRSAWRASAWATAPIDPQQGPNSVPPPPV